jgi:hypothetical protein
MQAKAVTLVAIIATMAAGSAFAHHSFAMYDREKTVTISGTVKDYVWSSPHVTIVVLADNTRRGVLNIEGSSPVVLARGGWTSSLLKPGDKILLGVHPRKDGGAGGLLADEQQLLVNGQPPKGVLWLTPPGKEVCEQ